jgi:hypothetical protein
MPSPATQQEQVQHRCPSEDMLVTKDPHRNQCASDPTLPGSAGLWKAQQSGIGLTPPSTIKQPIDYVRNSFLRPFGGPQGRSCTVQAVLSVLPERPRRLSLAGS